jgi:hypothetical protein
MDSLRPPTRAQGSSVFVREELDRPINFDYGGERVLVIGRHGLLLTWRIDGTDAEILPRPVVDGQLMMHFRGVIGVAGGFIVAGYQREHQVLAHYDFPSRTCVLHTVAAGPEIANWCYYRDLHTIAMLFESLPGHGVAFDLGATGADPTATPRALSATERVWERGAPEPATVPVHRMSPGEPQPAPRDSGGERDVVVLTLNSRTGTLQFGPGQRGARSSVTPLTDGLPALNGGYIVQACEGGDVLAVQVDGAVAPGLYFISRSRAAVLGRFLLGDDPVPKVFALSRDGRRFARLIGDRRLEVRDVPGDLPPLLVSAEEDIEIHFASLGRSCLLVREFDTGGPRRPRASCLIRWDQGRLEFVHRDGEALLDQLGGIVAESRSLPTGHPVLRHDPDPLRWVQFIESPGLQILIDRYNHLAALGRGGELIGLFYLTRDEAAAWMPDGTRLGSRRLIGGEPTPGAAERFAAVLRSAGQGEGASS